MCRHDASPLQHLLHTKIHCNILQRTTMMCRCDNSPGLTSHVSTHTATYCNILQRPTTMCRCDISPGLTSHFSMSSGELSRTNSRATFLSVLASCHEQTQKPLLQRVAAWCRVLYHILEHTATRCGCDALQLTATATATHYIA